MKIFSTFVMAAALLLGASSAYAADGIKTVTDYTEDFNTSFTTSSSSAWSVSKGWTYAKIGTYGTTYTYKATGGVDGTGGLQISSQTSSAYDSYVITPKVTGTSTLAVKDLGYYTLGYISVFEMSQDADGKWSAGTELVASTTYPLEKGGDWITIQIPAVEGKCIGIKGSNVMVDNFYAQSVDIELFKKLTVSNVKVTSSSAPDCDAEGNFTVVISGTITNSGDMDFKVGDEGFSYGIGKYTSSSPYVMVKTQAFENDLAVGQSADVNVEATLNTADYPGRLRYDLVENFGGTGAYGAWIEPTPYAPILRVYNSNHYSIKDAGTYQSEFGKFGKITEDYAKTVTIGNVGAAPMTATVAVPAGFEASATTVQVAAHAEETVTITAKASAPGIFSGNLTIANGEIETVEIPVSAIVLDANKYFEDFQGNASAKTAPQGWIELADKTQWSKTTFTAAGTNNFMTNSTYSTLTKLATPLLKVTEGEKLAFDASRCTSSATSNNSVINVYYSANRQDWTLVKTVANADMPYTAASTSSASSQNWQTITVEGIPAGNYYVAFEAGYANIDDVYGCERVDVDHDVVAKTVSIPANGAVNSEYFANVTLYNLNDEAEAEGSYTATLYFNGEAVATAEASEIASEATSEYTFSFTPHATGTFPAYVKYQWTDGYTVEVPAVDVTVRAETATEAFTVGTKTTTDSSPLFTNYKNSVSETLYTAEQLAAAGIKNGDRIASITYYGYKTTDDLTTQVKAFVKNCDDTSFGGTTVTADADMTKVFDGEYTFVKKGAYGESVEIMTIDFDEPFTYTGGALRVKVQSEADTYKSMSFDVDGNVSQQTYGQRSDGTKVADFTSYSAWKFPVTTFGVVLSPAYFLASVKNESQQALEGVSVVLTAKTETEATDMMAAPVVQYFGETDASGVVEISVVKSALTYTAEFSKDGYETETIEVSFPLTNFPKIVMKESGATGINDLQIGSAKAVKVIENGEVIIIKDGVRYNIMGQKK